MPNSRCFLIGHRDTSSDILPSLTAEIERHIREQRITEFVVGQYGGFDRLAAHALYRCKTEYPGLTLTLLCAYHPAERAVILPRGFDGFWYPAELEQVPRRFAIQRANRLAVEQSEYLIAGLRRFLFLYQYGRRLLLCRIRFFMILRYQTPILTEW